MYPIASQVVSGSTTSNFAFNSIPQNFTHLQLRVSFMVNTSSSNDYGLILYINNDVSSTNNSHHQLFGDGSTAYSKGIANQSLTNLTPVLFPYSILVGGSSINPSSMQSNRVVAIIDYLDYANTNKNKTIKILGGWDNNGTGAVFLNSELWSNTAAITNIGGYCDNAPNFTVGSRFDLYGIQTA
jgi:hypothetical protein